MHGVRARAGGAVVRPLLLAFATSVVSGAAGGPWSLVNVMSAAIGCSGAYGQSTAMVGLASGKSAPVQVLVSGYEVVPAAK